MSTRRHFLTITAAALATPALPRLGSAAGWPTDKTIRAVVPFSAGSTIDILGRLVLDPMSRQLGQTIVIENRGGAGGSIGSAQVAKAEPDGYTIGISIGGPLAINPILFGKLPYNPATDLALITMLATQPSVLAVSASLGVGSVADLVALLRREPGKHSFGSIGTGSLSHLAMEAIAIKSDTRIVHIPYPSSPQAVTALMRGDVQIVCLPAISVTPQVAGGRVKILAVSTAARSALLPGIPTLKESGIDVEADAWMGLIAPARTPQVVIAAIQRAFAEAVASPAMREKLAAQLMEPIPTTPAEFRARIEADIARWAPVIKAANIKIN